MIEMHVEIPAGTAHFEAGQACLAMGNFIVLLRCEQVGIVV